MERTEGKQQQAWPDSVGNLCVVQDDDLSGWVVHICLGPALGKTHLGKFSTRGEAESFATAEVNRRNATPGEKRYVLRIDQCPCWQKHM